MVNKNLDVNFVKEHLPESALIKTVLSSALKALVTTAVIIIAIVSFLEYPASLADRIRPDVYRSMVVAIR